MEARRRIACFLPQADTYWPASICGLYFGATFLTYRERLALSVFLYGNGVCDLDILAVMLPKCRDSSAAKHVKATVDSLRKGVCASRWHYFDVVEQDYLLLDGSPYGNATGSRSVTRTINAWDRIVNQRRSRTGRVPTLREQREFFSD